MHLFMQVLRQLGLCNAYFAALDNPLLWTGVLHGIYGLGAFASPQVATVMVTRNIHVSDSNRSETGRY